MKSATVFRPRITFKLLHVGEVLFQYLIFFLVIIAERIEWNWADKSRGLLRQERTNTQI